MNKKKAVLIHLETALHHQLKDLADRLHTNPTALARRLVVEGMQDIQHEVMR